MILGEGIGNNTAGGAALWVCLPKINGEPPKKRSPPQNQAERGHPKNCSLISTGHLKNPGGYPCDNLIISYGRCSGRFESVSGMFSAEIQRSERDENKISEVLLRRVPSFFSSPVMETKVVRRP